MHPLLLFWFMNPPDTAHMDRDGWLAFSWLSFVALIAVCIWVTWRKVQQYRNEAHALRITRPQDVFQPFTPDRLVARVEWWLGPLVLGVILLVAYEGLFLGSNPLRLLGQWPFFVALVLTWLIPAWIVYRAVNRRRWNLFPPRFKYRPNHLWRKAKANAQPYQKPANQPGAVS